MHHLTYLRGSLSQHGIFKDTQHTVTRVSGRDCLVSGIPRKPPIGTGQVIQATVLIDSPHDDGDTTQKQGALVSASLLTPNSQLLDTFNLPIFFRWLQ
jgi:hypothetical protein